MKYSMLYYPNFEPNQKWLRSVLLFVDEVQRIIPKDAEHTDSPKTQKLLDLMPDALSTVSPNEADKYFDELNFARLEKACALIRDQAGGSPYKKFVFNFDREGGCSLKGHVWLSSSKLEERVRELLFAYNLASDIPNTLLGRSPFGDTFPANEEAANLIVSYIADRMARRTGLDTITGIAIPYTVQSLDALIASPTSLHREGEGLLAATVANLAVPEGIERLEVHQYQELRESFKDIRDPFHNLIRSLSMRSNFNRQQSAMALERRLEQAIKEYKGQMEAYKNTAFSRKFDRWIPVFFQGLLGMLSPLSSTSIQAVEAAGILAIETVKQIDAINDNPPAHESTYRMLCQLEKKIDQKVSVASLL